MKRLCAGRSVKDEKSPRVWGVMSKETSSTLCTGHMARDQSHKFF